MLWKNRRKFLRMQPMRERLPALCIVMGLVLCACGYLSQHATTGMILLGGVQNLGSVSCGSKVSLHATVFNLHPYPVKVDAEPTCGCTQLDVEPQQMPPFGAAYLWAQIDTNGLRLGAQNKMLLLHFTHQEASWTRTILVRFNIINPNTSGERS